MSANRNHRAHAKPPLYKETQRLARGASQRAPRPPYREFSLVVIWWERRFGSRDAYQGYFANRVDNARYYGSGRATLIFRQ
jgi:hypothetical protein